VLKIPGDKPVADQKALTVKQAGNSIHPSLKRLDESEKVSKRETE